MSVRFQIDTSVMEQVQQRLGQFSHRAPGAISSALNRAMTTVATAVPREGQEEYHVKTGDIKKTLKKSRASRSKLSAEVRSTGSPLGIEKFKVSPKTVNPRRKSQLKIAVKKSGAKTSVGSFIASINDIKVFKRVTKSRLPIERLFGPSAPQMVDDEESVQQIHKKGTEMFSKRIEHEINRILGQLGAS